ncbi:DUF2470 domain-containing protein [Kribbella deserti]|uniref:DUF2470 domain-containing protein n=1 Tax=Kribbella deserti TaxID=1926257 RepID=A0ABV6QPW5_9ACTN
MSVPPSPEQFRRDPLRPDPFAPHVVDAVLQHMNEDHAEDCLLIVRMLGGVPDAVAVALTAIDPAGAVYAVGRPQRAAVQVVIPWKSQIVDRPQFRNEFARMYRQAADLQSRLN